ncbi:MAG: GNAT family N-acetyltransferase, partial [Candidatus Aenigmatarchaeota archaeon]
YSVKNENAIFLVAEDKERIVGYVTGFILPSKEDEAMVHETRVDPEQRGRGVGTKLVNKFCEQASERGVELIYAYIESELKSFYIKSCDFKETENNWIEVSKKT